MKRLVLAVTALSTFIPAANAAAPAPETAVVTGNTAFAADLWARVRTEKGNVFFSPSSISTALAMAYAGARGDTAKQIAKTMHYDVVPANDLHAAQGLVLTRLSSSGPDVPQLAIANRLWTQKDMTLETPFATTTKTHYGAGVELLNFKTSPEPSRLAINNWVASKTNDKIKDLLPSGSINPATRIVLTNAIWFKGTWAQPFAKSETRDEAFATPSGSAKVPTMHATLHARYGETKDAQVLELPYSSKDPSRAMSMVVVLPKTNDALAKMEAAPQFDAWTASLGGKSEVILSLPKFKTTQTLSLGKTLEAMGMVHAFDASKADFSGISTKEPLWISAVLHKAFVEVNEEGTEAAAATAIMVEAGTAAAPSPKTFKVDRPFAFYIRDHKTGSVLFVGRINDPRA
jgi:serpin B